jgi:glutaminyl-peptide cyclotransferase
MKMILNEQSRGILSLFICLLIATAYSVQMSVGGPLPVGVSRWMQLQVPKFDGKAAYAMLLRQTNLGPRAPGSAGHEKCLQFLLGELRTYADAVQQQRFWYKIPPNGKPRLPRERGLRGKQVQLTNIISSFNVNASKRILLTAHWDTRLWADQDPDPKNRTKPIVGANDGASGVAVLLEVARLLKRNPPPIGVDIVLFDGEDLGTTGLPESFSAGAKYFARNLPAGRRPRFAINIDMIGDSELRIPREVNSDRYAPQVMNLIFATAQELGISQFVDSPGSEVTDDHMPLMNVGIPAVDLIDFSYPDETNKYWHTMADTPDKCSSESLSAVGRVLIAVVYSKASTLE